MKTVQSSGTSKKLATVVGIDRYLDRDIEDLKYTVKDAESLHTILVDPARGKFLRKYVHLITNKTKQEILSPLKSNIVAAIKSMSRSAGSEDTILFFFSGHGKEVDGQAYLLCYETRSNVLKDTALPLRWIKKTLTESDASGKVIILDACHAGLQLGKAVTQPMTKAFEESIFEKSEGFAILASCKMNELSREWEEKSQGVFTYYLNEGLMGAADIDKNGVVTVLEASKYVTEKVRNWAFRRGYQQNPTLEYRVSGDLPLAYVPRRRLIQELSIPIPSFSRARKISEECITHISLTATIASSSPTTEFKNCAGNLCAILLNYFELGEIRECESGRIYVFPLGNIMKMTKEDSIELNMTFSYDVSNRELISDIICVLDGLQWEQISYNFNRRFDHANLVSWLKKKEIKILSYRPEADPTKDMTLEALAEGWGRDCVPATVVFRNHEKGSRLGIIQTDKDGTKQMEPDFFTKLSPQNVLGLLKDIFV